LEDRCLLSGLLINPRSQITTISRAPSHLDLFTVNADGNVCTNSYVDITRNWQNQWRIIDDNFTVVPGSKIAAVARVSTHMDIFVVGNDGRVWSTYWDAYVGFGSWPPTWASWYQLPPLPIANYGVFLPGTPISAVSRGANHLDIYLVDSNGQVVTDCWDANQNNGQWQAWKQVSFDPSGFATGTTITAISHLPDFRTSDPTTTNVDLFGVDKAGNVMWDSSAPIGPVGAGGSYTYGYGSWSPTGSIAAGVSNTMVVGAVYRRPRESLQWIGININDFDDVNIFVVADDSHVYTNWRNQRLNGGLWHTWSAVGALQTFGYQQHNFGGVSIAVTARTDTHMDIFVLDAAGDVMTNSWDETSVFQPAGNWHAWTAVDQIIDSNGFHTLNSAASVVTAVNRGTSHLDIFLISYDGRAMSDWWDQNANNGDWNNWFRIGDHLQIFPVGRIHTSTTPDWFDTNLGWDRIRTLARDFWAEGSVDRNEMLSLLYSMEWEGTISLSTFPNIQVVIYNPGPCNLEDYADNLGLKVLQDLGLNFNVPAWETDINNVFFGQALPTTTYDTGTKDSKGNEIWLTPTYQTVTGELFGPGGPGYQDVQQNQLGDCWLLASLAEVAARTPSAIQGMFINNYDGTYTVRFFNGATPDYVTVDSELPQLSGVFPFDGPVVGSDGKLILWVALAEKAYAEENVEKFLPSNNPGSNSYQSLNFLASSLLTFVMPSFTGVAGGDFWWNPPDVTNTWQSGQLVVLATPDFGNSPPSITDKSGNTVTIVSTHVYAVVGYDTPSKQFTLFNPYGVNGGRELLPNGTRVYCGGFVKGTEVQLWGYFDTIAYEDGSAAVPETPTTSRIGDLLLVSGNSVGTVPIISPGFLDSNQNRTIQQPSASSAPLNRLALTDELFAAVGSYSECKQEQETAGSLFTLPNSGLYDGSDALFAPDRLRFSADLVRVW
jgi:hypothetical protein